ncbi:PDDEXK family nuclease [Emticicia fontis]
MKRFVNEIAGFIRQHSNIPFLYNFDAFPSSPFTYIYLPEKQMVIHCVSLEPQLQDGQFFQHLSESFTQQGLRVIHLWEDVWHTQEAIVQSRLLSILGKSATIPARLTKNRRIDKPTLDAFLSENHLQIPTGAKFKYGLYLPKRYFRVIDVEKNRLTEMLRESLEASEEMLMAVASFSSARTFVRAGVSYRSFELIRFANMKGFTVVGGFDKLLKAFIREQKPDDIMTYADADWSDGASYEKLGFERIELTAPQSFGLDENLQKIWKGQGHKTSEKQVWNAGSWKYLLKLKQG